jgi:uncharacterized membrane protein YdjX (TVP38/TMEM64 family)
MKYLSRCRVVTLVTLLLALGVAAWTVDVPDVATLQYRIRSTGAAAPLVFVAAYAALVPAPLPKSVLSTAAGMAFGLPLGLALVLAGATSGAVIAFGIARLLGRDVVSRMAGGTLGRVDDVVERHGVTAALVIRFVPVMPFTVLNYACGVSAMRLSHYALGTAVGIAPSSTALVVLGSAGARVSLWVPASASVTLGLASLGAGALWKHFKYRNSNGM